MVEQPRTPSRVNRVQAGDLTLAVAEYEGQGSPLFLLHGIGSNGSSWWPVIDALAVHFRVFVPDWRGHGASGKPERGYLVPDYSADLTSLLAAYGHDRPLIMGHSLGGMVALHWASKHPGRARRIAVEDAPLRRHHNVSELFDGWIALASQSAEATAAHYAREYPHWTPEECRRRAETITTTNLGVFSELRDHNLRHDDPDWIAPLAAVATPTLLVYGDTESGGMVPTEDATRFAATVPHATIEQIVGGSHSLHRDSSSAFLAIVVPYLLGESRDERIDGRNC